MSIEVALIAALKADSGVSALVAGRVSIWGGQQETVYPYVTIHRVTTTGAAFLDGPSNLDWPLFQIDVWSPVGLDTLNVAEAIRVAIDGRQIDSNPDFFASFQDQEGTAPDEETRNFRVRQDYLLFHERT